MKITDLANGTRSIEDLIEEHHGWDRNVVHSEKQPIGEIVVYGRTPAEEHVRQLNLLATQLEDTDLEEAIACMRRSDALNKAIGRGMPDRRSLRLSRFLQKAGRMQEAMQEFNRALRDVERWAFGNTPMERAAAIASNKTVVYDQMRIAWKREGDAKKVQSATLLAEWHRVEGERLHAAIDAARQEAFIARKSRKRV